MSDFLFDFYIYSNINYLLFYKIFNLLYYYKNVGRDSK